MSEESGKEQPSAQPDAKDDEQQAGRQKKPSRKRRAFLVLALVLLVGCCAGAWFWYRHQVRISTDDAFVEAHIHNISARVTGHVRQVPVEDNQLVQAGDLLVALDRSDYQTNVERARAMLMLAENQTSGDYAQVNAAVAALQQAEAQRDQARLDLTRGEALFAREVMPKQQLDRLRTAARVAAGQVDEAREKLQQARATVGMSPSGNRDALIARRQAELAQAELELSYTRISAPATGYITRKSVEPGNNVQPGQGLMALVQLDTPWVVANYKETELTHLRPGMKVEFTVDAYPDLTFTGRVESIMAGTGAAFSLLPPENATGNYVKVVQRVPVKIAIDPESDPERKLRVGMSVVPTVITGRGLRDVLGDLNPFD